MSSYYIKQPLLVIGGFIAGAWLAHVLWPQGMSGLSRGAGGAAGAFAAYFMAGAPPDRKR